MSERGAASTAYSTSSLVKFDMDQLMEDMRGHSFNTIRFATYRAACKLRFVQKYVNMNLVDIWNVIESFRENGLNAIEYTSEVKASRVELLLSTMYHNLNKRLPLAQQIDTDKSIATLLSFLMAAYDRDGCGKLRVFSLKVALATICAGKLLDKLRYIFSQISDPAGVMEWPKFVDFLREALALPTVVFEGPTFGYTDVAAKSCFEAHIRVTVNTFLDSLMTDPAPPCLMWLPLLHRMASVEHVFHPVVCDGCHVDSFTGFRYRCQRCHNYQLCQECFWRGRISQSHSTQHEMKEYSSYPASAVDRYVNEVVSSDDGHVVGEEEDDAFAGTSRGGAATNVTTRSTRTLLPNVPTTSGSRHSLNVGINGYGQEGEDNLRRHSHANTSLRSCSGSPTHFPLSPSRRARLPETPKTTLPRVPGERETRLTSPTGGSRVFPAEYINGYGTNPRAKRPSLQRQRPAGKPGSILNLLNVEYDHQYTYVPPMRLPPKLESPHLTDVRLASVFHKSPVQQLGHSIHKSLRCTPGSTPAIHPIYPEIPERPLDLANVVPVTSCLMVNQAACDVDAFYEQQLPMEQSMHSTLNAYLPADGMLDDEHKLIARYSAKLAGRTQHPGLVHTDMLSVQDENVNQRALIARLEQRNKEILREIQIIAAQQAAEEEMLAPGVAESGLSTELDTLRHRKYELEGRMRHLQDNRHELVGQLEHMMRVLKTTGGTTPHEGSPHSPTSLVGIGGDIQEAFRGTSMVMGPAPPPHLHGSMQRLPSAIPPQSGTLQGDLLNAADNITNTMSSLVRQMGRPEYDDDTPVQYMGGYAANGGMTM